MNTFAFLLLLAAQQEVPEERPRLGKPGKKEDVAVQLKAGLELRYDDNITELSDEDVEALEEGANPTKFRIDEPDDFITAPWIEVGLGVPIFAEPTVFGLNVQAHYYATNSVKDYQELTLFARQKVSRKGMLEAEYEFTPEFYRREYRVPATGVRDSAFFSQHQFDVSYRHRFDERWTLRPRIGWRFRDYESPFHFRDTTGVFLSALGSFEPAPWVELRLEIEYENVDAKAHSNEPDTSHVESAIEPGVAFKPVEGLELGLRLRFAVREYTSNNDPLVDPSHVDREDRIGRTTIYVSYKISKHWEVDGEVKIHRTDSDRPADPGATDEETEFDRNIFTLGVTWRL